MAKTPTETKASASGMSPTDQLIAAMANLVNDRAAALEIKHMFFRQDNNGCLQISLDMHEDRA
jgi:hypothetical protein